MQIRFIVTLITFVFFIQAHASRYHFHNSVEAGSKYFWKHGQEVGSHYYWKHGQGPGSQYYWKHGQGPGSHYYWKHGQGVSSGYHYENGRDTYSKYHWEHSREIGSHYFWMNSTKPSISPVLIAVCLSESLDTEMCRAINKEMDKNEFSDQIQDFVHLPNRTIRIERNININENDEINISSRKIDKKVESPKIKTEDLHHHGIDR